MTLYLTGGCSLLVCASGFRTVFLMTHMTWCNDVRVGCIDIWVRQRNGLQARRLEVSQPVNK